MRKIVRAICYGFGLALATALIAAALFFLQAELAGRLGV